MKVLALVLAVLLLLAPCSYAGIEPDDVAVMTTFGLDAGFKVDASGDLVPIADSTNDIGETGAEVAEIYVDAIIATSLTPSVVNAMTVLGENLTNDGTDLYWAGIKLTN